MPVSHTINALMPHMHQSTLDECFDACHVCGYIQVINFHLSLLSGEWEISAFDGSLKSRGMSIRYTVRPCDSGDLQQVDRDGFDDDISDYIDQIDPQPRGRRAQNHTVLVRVCKKLTNNNTQSVNTSSQTAEGKLQCYLRKVAVTSQGGGNPNMLSEGEIPKDILEEIERDGKYTVTQKGTEPGEKMGDRQRRQAEENWTDSSEVSEDTGSGSGEHDMENRTDTSAEIKPVERNEMPSEKNKTKEQLEQSNEILLNSRAHLNKKFSTVVPVISEEMDENVSQNHIQSEPERLTADMDLEYNYTASNNTTSIDFALEYDDYSQEVLWVFFCVLHTFIKYILRTIQYAKY